MATATVDKAKTRPGLIKLIQSPDIQFAVALVGIIFTMILPMPTWLLDMLLACSVD
jgi:flagellar biosynthesis component FlhA